MTTTLKLNETQLAAAREWCLECWPFQEDEINEATPELIERNVAKYWCGGIEDFIASNP